MYVCVFVLCVCVYVCVEGYHMPNKGSLQDFHGHNYNQLN
jgi:hypothetical protein